MTMRALRSTARRIQVLQAEADELYAQLQRLTAAIAPWLLELFGVGPISAVGAAGLTVGPRSRAQGDEMTRSGPPVPLAEGGIAQFEALADELPRLLDRLRRAPVWSSERDGPLPAVPGVYLLSEEHPIYVGQTRNLRRRLRQHGGISSRENQASLAFNIARRKAADHPSFNIHLKRRALEADPAFAQLFREARARVARMQVRYVEIDDPELRTVFEVYAAVAFGTAEHNSFETH